MSAKAKVTIAAGAVVCNENELKGEVAKFQLILIVQKLRKDSGS